MLFYRMWQYVQSASQPQTTCNHASPGPPHLASSPAGSSETSHLDSRLNCGFAQENNLCKTVRNHLREAHLRAHHPNLGLNKCTSINWFPHLNCNSIKSLKLLHVVSIFLFTVIMFQPIRTDKNQPAAESIVVAYRWHRETHPGSLHLMDKVLGSTFVFVSELDSLFLHLYTQGTYFPSTESTICAYNQWMSYGLQ